MKYITAIAILLASSMSFADVSVAIGEDHGLANYGTYAEMRYAGNHWSAYAGTDKVLGIDVNTVLFDSVLVGIGVEHLDVSEEILTTSWSYQLRLEYELTNSWSIGIKHSSNCKKICEKGVFDSLPHGEKGTNNIGLNIVYIRYAF